MRDRPALRNGFAPVDIGIVSVVRRGRSSCRRDEAQGREIVGKPGSVLVVFVILRLPSVQNERGVLAESFEIDPLKTASENGRVDQSASGFFKLVRERIPRLFLLGQKRRG